MPEAGDRPELMALDADPPDCGVDEARRFAREIFGIDGTPEPKRGERDRNFLIRGNDGREFILKVANAAEDPGVIDLQSRALRHLESQDPDIRVPRIVPTLDGDMAAPVRLAGGETTLVRAQTYLAGARLGDSKHTPGLLRAVGRSLAGLDKALRGFFHPAARQDLAWDLMRAPDLAPYAALLEDADERAMVTVALDRFCTETIPALRRLRGQVIHNDANLGNVLIEDAASEPVVGFVDFGDMLHGPLVLELAIAAADIVLAKDDPVAAAAHVIAGFHSVVPLEADEVAVLHDAILARLAVTLAIHAWRRDRHGEMSPDLTSYEVPCNTAMQQLLATGREAAKTRYREACGLPSPPSPPADRRASTDEDLLNRRRRLLGPRSSLFYDRPLHIVRGEGVWLYNADGRAYLDAYNNVAHVGHCHPRVIAAITAQAATLNTNIRYLHPTVLDYTERLTATMPDGLDVCIFVNSGSEANDVAWRLAKACTGQSGALIMDNAYHGGTDAIFALSPEEYDTKSMPPHIETLEAPDPLRGRFGANADAAADAGARYAEDADRAIADLGGRGHRPAAFMVDTGVSTNGILDLPDGYLPAVADKVRGAGGLVIADEVQYGFGRPGSHMWGFERYGMQPDIVTLGKPVGNGHPIGVVVTRAALLAEFTKGHAYFSTFGGNPVSCAAARAVLDVLQQEGLQENAARTGAHLRAGLAALGQRYPAIADVRGRGLFIGVEIVTDRESLTPDPAAARRIINAMKDRGVLISVTGPHRNVLKIRPPMPFATGHADRLVETLDDVLSDGVADT